MTWLRLQFSDLRDLGRALRFSCLTDLVFHIHIFLTGMKFGLTSGYLLMPTTFGKGDRALAESCLVAPAFGWTSKAAGIGEVLWSDVKSLNFLWHGLNHETLITYSAVSEILQRIFQKIIILDRKKNYHHSLVRVLFLLSGTETTAFILLELH